MDTFVAFEIAIVGLRATEIHIERLVNHRAQLDGLFKADLCRVVLADVGQELAQNLLLNLATYFFGRQIGLVVHAVPHTSLELIHAFRKGVVFLDGLKQTPSWIVERVPQKIFQRTLRHEAEDTEDGQDRRTFGQKGNVHSKGRRTARGRTCEMHLERTRRAEFFVGPKTANFARDWQLSGTSGRRMRDVDINSLNFLRLDDLGIAANDKLAALILETFFQSGAVVQIGQMALFRAQHDRHVHERHLALRRRWFRVRVLIGGDGRIGRRVAHFPDDVINVDKDVADLGQTARTSLVRQERLTGHDAHILGRVNTRAVGFLDEGLVDHDVAELDGVLRPSFIVENFNLGKFAHDKRHHVIHKMIKVSECVSGIRTNALVAVEQCILETFVTLQFGIKLLSLDHMLGTARKHDSLFCNVCACVLQGVCKASEKKIEICTKRFIQKLEHELELDLDRLTTKKFLHDLDGSAKGASDWNCKSNDHGH